MQMTGGNVKKTRAEKTSMGVIGSPPEERGEGQTAGEEKD